MSDGEIFMLFLVILMMLAVLIGVISSIPSLIWIRKMRKDIETLDDKYKKVFSYMTEVDAGAIDLQLKSLSTYLSGVYYSAIIFIGVIAVLVLYYIGLLFETRNFRQAYEKFYMSIRNQFEEMSNQNFNEFGVIIFLTLMILFIVSFLVYVGLFVLMSNILKTISKDDRINTFYNKIKDKKVLDIDEKNSKLIIQIIDLVKQILDSSSTAITSFGIASIIFAIILIIAGVS